jgi:hypothetical protein
MPGIFTSASKQDVLPRKGEARKVSADEKAWTAKPSDLIRLVMASRKDSSSSTTEMRCFDTSDLRGDF